MGTRTRIGTHEDKNSINISLQSFREFTVVFSRHLQIYVEEMIQPIYKVGFALIFAVLFFFFPQCSAELTERWGIPTSSTRVKGWAIQHLYRRSLESAPT